MVVPVGGSDCAKCEYFHAPKNCSNEAFQKWNGSRVLPAEPDRYCCDLFEATEEKAKAQGRKKALGRMLVVVVGGRHE